MIEIFMVKNMVEFLFFKMQITDIDFQVALCKQPQRVIWVKNFERAKVPGATNKCVCVSVFL